MSVSQFPNATEGKVDELSRLFEQLLGNEKANPHVKPTLELITQAHLCAIFDAILNSREIQAHVPYDPVVVQEMRDVLRDCT